MATEQSAGETSTGAADWYAVGVMLREALAESAPSDLELLCAALTRRDPEARPGARAILEMLGDAPPAAAEPRADLREAFVGRAGELSALRAEYDAVRRGELRVARIHGQPGVGKSALFGKFLEELRAQNEALVLTARCHEREVVPYKAFDGISDALAGYLQDLPREEAASLVVPDLSLVPRLFPSLEAVSSLGGAPRREAEPTDPRERRLRAFSALRGLIARIGGRRPLVLAIDDLQWGDVDSARLLSHLVAPPDRPRVLLLLCYRTEGDERSPTLREALRMLEVAGASGGEIGLAPLPASDAEELAARLLDADRGASRAAGTIAERAEGHPLFIAELARALSRPDAAEGAPPTLMDILWRRITRLSSDARGLLETVAAAGQPSPGDLCFEAAGLGGRGVDAVRLLRADRLVRTTDSGAIDVFHDHIRDAVLTRAGVEGQRQRHLALARAMERRPGADPEALARHFDAAGEREQAARYARRAGEAALEALAFDRAAALYRMAIARSPETAPASSRLHEKLGDALLNAGSNLAAGEAYLAAAARSSGDRVVELKRRAAEQMLTVGDIKVGYRALEEALDAVGEALPASLGGAKREIVRNAVRGQLGGLRFREKGDARVPRRRLLRLDVLESAARGLDPNDPARSLAIRGRFSRVAMATGEPRRAALGLIHGALGLQGFRRSRPAVVDALLDRAEALGRRLSDPAVIGQAALMRGMSYAAFGDWPAAAERFERAAALFEERCVGMAYDRRLCLLQAAYSHLRAGALETGRRLGEALFLDGVERGDPMAEKNACAAVLAPVSLADDSLTRAQDYLARVGVEDRCVSVIFRAETTAAAAMYQGQPRAAVEAWRSRWQRIEEMCVLAVAGFRVTAVRSLGTALLASPENRRDVREAARLAKSIRRFQFPYAAGAYANLRALLALHDQRPARAAALFEKAAREYDRASMILEAAACRHRRGTITRGDEGAAQMAAAEEGLRAAGIADPVRWVATVAPPVALRP